MLRKAAVCLGVEMVQASDEAMAILSDFYSKLGLDNSVLGYSWVAKCDQMEMLFKGPSGVSFTATP